MGQVKKEQIIEILKQCYDPELPVDLWNLGLIYDIQIQESYDENKSSLLGFSKIYDDDENKTPYIVLTTCNNADENCPFIPGADERIPVRYNDPKGFDNTDMEEQIYDERSNEIATELFYVFSQIK